MVPSRWLWTASVICLLVCGCNKHRAKKPDPTKGAVTGIVLCADTGKPARFATVTLSPAPQKEETTQHSAPLAGDESTMTDLEGRFRLEAVEPGRYFAFATLEGYLDPMRSLDFTRLEELANDHERDLDAIKQWRDHLAEVNVRIHHTADLTLQIERGAEISGAVAFDDGSPAIGMHFQVSRKAENGRWTDVGLALFDQWSLPTISDSRGRFTVTNLPSGEYTVCALMPADGQDAAPRICLGNTFRRRDAAKVKTHAGETASGADIVIPLAQLHTVSGEVTALADGHALTGAKVRLLYADDSERAQECSVQEDGEFAFEYVPEGKYILQIRGALDPADKTPEAAQAASDSPAPKADTPHRYADKDLPINVMGNIEDLQVQLTAIAPEKPQAR